MGILSNDIFEKLITVGDKYYISLLYVNCPYYTNIYPDPEKLFPFRGIDYVSPGPSIRAIETQIAKEILEAPITKVQYTTKRYAHIKNCIKKHVNLDAYHCTWETCCTWVASGKEPEVIHVVCKYRRRDEWVNLITVAITLKDEEYYKRPF